MKIVAISDTHERHEQVTIPECDILIHSGDITNRGSLLALYKFCAWFKQQPAKHKIMIYGNHELGFSRGPKREEALNTSKQFDIIYLENSDITIDSIKIYGSPVTPFFYNWEWNVPRGEDIAKIWAKIPEDTNVLITHGPPYGILDLVDDTYLNHDPHQGCEELRKKVDALPNLKVHAFGHLHLQGGNTIAVEGKTFANAAMVNDSYKITRQPIVIDI